MAIEVEGVVHEYGELRALNDVSFQVRAGEVFGYLGPNGAGKSTTVRILLGLLNPSQGRVVVADCDVATDPVGARERIGYLPETLCLYEALTAEEHLQFVGRMRRLDEQVIARRSEALLSTFGLTERAREPIRGYSKGMRQKVALSLALLHRPPVLVLDEPLAGLDATAALILKEVIRGCAKRGTAVLYCSHVLDVVERVCDRALILNQGRQVAAGTIDELVQSTQGTTLDEVFRSVATEQDPLRQAADLLAALDQ